MKAKSTSEMPEYCFKVKNRHRDLKHVKEIADKLEKSDFLRRFFQIADVLIIYESTNVWLLTARQHIRMFNGSNVLIVHQYID